MKSYVVIGMGRFGSEVARQLYKCGCEVLAVDLQSELIQQVSQDVTHAVVADSRDKEVLRMLGVGDFDCAVVGIGDDLAASVLITMNLKELGVPYLVCKAHDDTHLRILEKLGADRVVIPEKENAARLAKSLSSPNLLDYIELSDEYSIIELSVPKIWIGKTLRELNVRAKLGLNILAVRCNGKMDVSPAADFSFGEGDVVIVLGDAKALTAVQKL